MALTFSDVRLWRFEDGTDANITINDMGNEFIMDWSTLETNIASDYAEKVRHELMDALSKKK
jgi:hypothetical protein